MHSYLANVKDESRLFLTPSPSCHLLVTDHLLPGHGKSIQKSLHRRLSIAVLPGTRAPFVILVEPFVEVRLKLLDRVIYLRPECDLVELVQNGPLEPFADSVGLRRLGLRFVWSIPSMLR